MKRKITAWTAAVLLLLALAVPASAAFNLETRESVVVVNTCLDMSSGEYSFGWGTGFFVGVPGEDPTYLVTNYHVISSYMSYGAGELITGAINGVEMTGRSKIRVYYDSSDFEEAYVVACDETKDVAVLKLGTATSKRKPLTLCSPSDDMVGSTVYAVGYPGLSENIFADATTSWGMSDASVTSGTFSRIFTTSGTGRINIQIDCVIRHGNSGGPLVNEDGAVLGVNTWSVTDTGDLESVNYAVSIDEVIPILKQYDIEYTMASELPQESAEDAAAEPEPEPEPSHTGLIVGICAAAAAVAAVSAAVVLLRKRRKPDRSPKAPKTPRRPVVCSLAAQHNRMRTALSDGQILIGRNPAECAVAFREGTPGVSGRHCSLSWDSATGDFLLTDLQSSYGTYLENGQRLTPGVAYRLKSGDRFYLGERANLLLVELE